MPAAQYALLLEGKAFPYRRVDVAADPFCGWLRPRNAPLEEEESWSFP